MGTARFLATCNWTFLTFERVALHEKNMRGIVGLSKAQTWTKNGGSEHEIFPLHTICKTCRPLLAYAAISSNKTTQQPAICPIVAGKPFVVPLDSLLRAPVEAPLACRACLQAPSAGIRGSSRHRLPSLKDSWRRSSCQSNQSQLQ